MELPEPKQRAAESQAEEPKHCPPRGIGSPSANTAEEQVGRILELAYTFSMALKFTTSYIEDALSLFRYYKRLAERAMEQVTDEQLFAAIDKEANSIAVIVKHMAGNMRSRWTDFLTTDGEKPERNRDVEFVDSFRSRAEILDGWERGWACLLKTLQGLKPEDLGKTVVIRGEPHSVPLALERSLGHTCYHIGQIVQIARIHAGDKWSTLTIPKGGSEQFNQASWGKSHS
jgi:Protein of unknown function (DUF1572)